MGTPVTLETALHLRNHRLSIIPTRPDGTKAPALPWKAYQTAPAPLAEINEWYKDGNPRNLGIAIVTGAASDRLEMTEIEGRAAADLPKIAATMTERGHARLWERLNAGWLELSPSGGFHWIYRLEQGAKVPGNTKLARNAAGEVLAETRGEGGYFIAAPTPGSHHKTGNPWQVLAGGPETTPTITETERAAFHKAITDTLDETPERPVTLFSTPKPTTTRPAAESPAEGGLKPGDDYEAKTDWADILTPHGWTLHSTLTSGERFWTRPGKHPRDGHSASTGHADDRDRLYVFSSSVPDFPVEEPITKFSAYSILNHGGDDTAAARALAAAGFGEKAPITVKLSDILPARHAAPPTPPPATTEAPAVGEPAEVQTVREQAPETAATTAEEPTATSDGATTITDWTELALIRAFTHLFNNHIRYNIDRGRFFHWTGTRWEEQPDTGGDTKLALLNFAAALKPPATDEGKPDKEAHALIRYARSHRGSTALLGLLKVQPTIAVPASVFDTHLDELNTPAGIINLRTGELMPHAPTRMHTKQTTVAPAGTSPTWERFLATTFNHDQALTGYMQRLAGYSATGLQREHVFAFAYGTGGNGKSVYYDALTGALGDYAATLPAGFLMRKPFQEHATELARLNGKRFVVGSETNATDTLDEAKLKMLTGGDRITARFMNKDFFEFTPTHHLHLMGNHQPAVEDGGESVWRRMNLVPFVHTVPAEERDELLPEKLRADAAAVLAWIIQGAVAYFRDGLQPPEAVRAATEAYKSSQDTVGQFLAARCDFYPGNKHYTVAVTDLRQAYHIWCAEEGLEPVRGRAFASQLKVHGVLVGRDAPRATHGGGRVFGGLQLKDSDIWR